MSFIVILMIGITAFIGSNVYLAWRLGNLLQGVFGYKAKYNAFVYGTVGALSLLLLLGIVTSARPFTVISAIYMGIWINLLLVTLICELVFFLIRSIVRDREKAIAKCVHQLLVLILPLILSLYGFINAAIPKTTDYEITLDKELDEVKIVMISDLHLGAVGAEAKLDGWVDGINRQKPDVVLIAGDMIDSDYTKMHDPEKAAALLSSIKATYGVYACLGNHDSGKTYQEMLSFFEASNINVLRDEYRVIADKFVLIGRYDLSPIGGEGMTDRRQETEAFLEALPAFDLPVFVMDHNPSDIASYDNRVDMIVSGHTHKGQVFPANFVTDLLYTVDYGLYRENAASPFVIVSCGIGGWGMPMRTAGHSEIVCITVKGQ